MIDGTAYLNRELTYDYSENVCLMPILSYDFNMLPQFIPGYFYSDDKVRCWLSKNWRRWAKNVMQKGLTCEVSHGRFNNSKLLVAV